jgi:hypothetical protein
MNAERFSEERIRDVLIDAAEIAGDGSACPAADQLVLSGRGELGPDDDSEVILHIAECTACAAAWRVSHEIAGEAASKVRPLVKKKKPLVQPWVQWAAAAALLVVIVGGGVLIFSPRETTAPIYREQEEEMLRSLVPEDEPLPRDRFVLRWVPAAEGAVYDVLVTTERMDTLARGTGLDDAEFQVAEGALEGVEAGAPIFWQVSAHLPDGRRIESPTFIVSVR